MSHVLKIMLKKGIMNLAVGCRQGSNILPSLTLKVLVHCPLVQPHMVLVVGGLVVAHVDETPTIASTLGLQTWSIHLHQACLLPPPPPPPPPHPCFAGSHEYLLRFFGQVICCLGDG